MFKKYFTSDNMATFVVAALASAFAMLVLVPAIRKFVPGFKRPASSTTTAPAA